MTKLRSPGPPPPKKRVSLGGAGSSAGKSTSDEGPFRGVRVIRKYPNRRLYDTQSSSYVSMMTVKDMVLGCEPFSVVDAGTGQDITRSLLVQILLDQESAGVPLFTESALANLIRLYGGTHQSVLGQWLERSAEAFGDWQRRIDSVATLGIKPGAPFPFDLTNPAGLLKPWVNQSQDMAAEFRAGWAEQLDSVFGAMVSGVAGQSRRSNSPIQADSSSDGSTPKRRRTAP